MSPGPAPPPRPVHTDTGDQPRAGVGGHGGGALAADTSGADEQNAMRAGAGHGLIRRTV